METVYLDKLRMVLQYGKKRTNRTGINALSVFGDHMRFDLTEQKVPLLTTKRVPWKSCIEELLWFLRGETDSKKLKTNIWRAFVKRY